MVPMFRVFCLSRFLTCVTIAETRLQKLLQILEVRACYDRNVTKITFCRVLNTPKASNLLVGQICGTVLCHIDWYGASKTC